MKKNTQFVEKVLLEFDCRRVDSSDIRFALLSTPLSLLESMV